MVDTATTDGGPLDVRLRRDLTIGERGGLPPFGAQVALGRVSATGPVASGSVAVYPGGTARPEAATLHVRADGHPTTTSAWLRLGQRGTLSAWADARTDLTVDVAGYVVGRPADPDPSVAPTAPTAAGSEPLADFDAAIDRFLRSHGVPGASVAVAQDGRVVYARAYGTADPATGEPVRVDSRFRYASTSKILTAAAVLDLVQSGRLELTSPAFPLIAGAVPVPPDADPRIGEITVADLLQHTSGLPASPDVFFNEGGQAPQTCADAARWVVTRHLVGSPGQGFSYVNMNFCILSLVVEAVTGEAYTTALQEQVLDPRGVHDVVLGQTAGRQPGEVASLTGDPSNPGVGWFMESLLGAGGLIGTPTDLVRVVDGLDPAKAGEHLLDPATYAALVTPGPGSWGLGVRLFGDGSYGHTGSLAGTPRHGRAPGRRHHVGHHHQRQLRRPRHRALPGDEPSAGHRRRVARLRPQPGSPVTPGAYSTRVINRRPRISRTRTNRVGADSLVGLWRARPRRTRSASSVTPSSRPRRPT